MTRDPIVREVREIRHQIDAECGKDPEKYFQHIQRIQKKIAKPLISRRPKSLPVSNQKTG